MATFTVRLPLTGDEDGATTGAQMPDGGAPPHTGCLSRTSTTVVGVAARRLTGRGGPAAGRTLSLRKVRCRGRQCRIGHKHEAAIGSTRLGNPSPAGRHSPVDQSGWALRSEHGEETDLGHRRDRLGPGSDPLHPRGRWPALELSSQTESSNAVPAWFPRAGGWAPPPLTHCCTQYRWQAAKCPGASSRQAGATSAQRGRAKGQRGWRPQPAGMAVAEATSSRSRTSLRCSRGGPAARPRAVPACTDATGARKLLGLR